MRNFFATLLLSLTLLALCPPGVDASWEAPARMPVGPAQTPAASPAEITVFLPQGAELWLNAHRSAQAGPARVFETPPLEAGRRYTYNVRLRWPGGEWSGCLDVRAGQRLRVHLPPGRGASGGAS